MTLLVLTLGASLLLLPGAAVPRWARLTPADWTRLNCASLRLGLWAVRTGLAMAALPTILIAVGVEQAAAACRELFGPTLAGGTAGGWIALAGLVALEARMAQSRRRRAAAVRRLQVERWLGRHSWAEGVDVVLVPTDEPLAYAVDGEARQVVISEGLARVLTPDEVHAVVRHELSHLAHGHQRHLALASAVGSSFGWLSPVRRSLEALSLGVERWADEDAASVPPSARPLVRSALEKVTSCMLLPVPTFNQGCTILARLIALDAEAPRPTGTARAAALAPLVALGSLGAITAAVLVDWSAYSYHGPLALVGYCPL